MSEIKNTINTEEINKFSRIADEWWKADGKFKSLHKFNPIRIKYIKENIIDNFNDNNSNNLIKSRRLLNKLINVYEG